MEDNKISFIFEKAIDYEYQPKKSEMFNWENIIAILLNSPDEDFYLFLKLVIK